LPRLPRTNVRRLLAALKRAGFIVRRQTGSHIILRHPETKRMAVAPDHSGTVGPGLLASVFRQAGLTASDLRRLLD